MNVTRDSAGWIALCACGWERFDPRRPTLDRAIHAHTCAKPRNAPKSAPPKPRADWNAREDSTWIDKL